ncbi:hypothetical protein DCAR_0310103 [Daucus carota subsp. sativus]|uniref:Uncharacterized protein n=1 Tax=Daucus carota subsp. sativus TaxID=79200 RepID=A0A165ZLG7_DAUCS|nr:hypothetical protein DCAR_0310103 [Daucus carota subsp. sativus]
MAVSFICAVKAFVVFMLSISGVNSAGCLPSPRVPFGPMTQRPCPFRKYVERSIPVQGVCQNDPLNLSDQATRNIGRPKVTISEDVLERRRLSKRRQNTRQTGQQGLYAKLAYSPGKEDEYVNRPSKYWDICGDRFDPGGHIGSFYQLSLAESEFEVMIQEGEEDDI